MKQANLGRGLLMLAVAAFFMYRYFQSGGAVYLLFIILFGGMGVLSFPNYLSSRWQNVGLNLGISLFFLDFVFADIKWAEFGQALAGANYWMLVPSTFFVCLHMYFRAVRWQWLLKPMGNVTFWPAFRGLVIGITGNTVLPAKAGEFLRAYVLGRSTGLSKVSVFATLVVERIFDGITVLLILLGVIILGVHNELLQQAGLWGAVVYVGAIGAIIVFIAKRQWADELINRFLPQNIAHISLKLLNSFSSGLAILKNPRHLVMVIIWNIGTWAVIPISFWFTLLAFDFGAPIPWQAPVLMLPALALALTIPGAPAGVGLVQFAAKLTLDTTFGDLSVATNFDELVAAASILIHLSQLVPEVIPGIISFMFEGLSTRDIQAGRTI